jgi:hypothetical protein
MSQKNQEQGVICFWNMTIGIVQQEIATESTGRQAAVMLPGIIL